MSLENVEIVRRMYDAFNAGDADAALAFFDPDVVLDASHRVDGRVGHGREELVAILGEWMGTWEGWHEEVEEIREAGDRVLLISTQTGRGKGSGVNWENRFGMLYEIQGGTISRWTVYDDLQGALEAAGLSD
jgi:ketosteroid isomerase-like protein